MRDVRAESQLTVSTQDGTRTGSVGGHGTAPAIRIPGLTILYHPDLDRVGERTVLDGLGAGRDEALSRHAPDFAAAGAAVSRPLGDPRLSRTPIVLRRDGERIVADRGGSRTRLEVDGREIDAAADWPMDALESGVVLLLGGRIVLLLHLLDPIADTSTPRFGMIGESPAIAALRRDVLRTADLDVPILLRGESGTGKELAARAIHDAGPRRQRPWMAVNMAAVPPSLAAAELFGVERGAYTGAERRRTGHFERAHGGTLFLDEVGETPPDVQALLLRALETGEIQAVGAEGTRRVDVRLISATDIDLETAIEKERFRAPLLHRLSGYVLRLAPLRERREDFGRLFVSFLRRELDALGDLDRISPGRRPWLPAALVARLAAWHWPGNVRQLANVVRQIAIANRGAETATRFGEVEKLLAQQPASAGPPRAGPARTGSTREDAPSPPSGRRRAADLREDEVVAALRAKRFRPAAAADALGIPRSSIYDLIKRIPGLRQASHLDRDEIEAARARVGASVEAMAADLEVSERALRRRLGQLGFDP